MRLFGLRPGEEGSEETHDAQSKERSKGAMDQGGRCAVQLGERDEDECEGDVFGEIGVSPEST
jgi:hypothetical protein